MKPLGTWVDWEKSVDTFKAGDPQTEVRAVAVGWMSTLQALRKASELGCNLFVTHEPTFYDHRDSSAEVHGDRAYREKKKLLDDTGMVVYRCHDVWDRFPNEGIQDSWVGGLGLGGRPYVDDDSRWLRVYEIEETPLSEISRDIAAKLKPLGQEAVQLVGDPAKMCRTLATGIGCYGGMSRFRTMISMGAGAIIATEVGYWRDVRWAEDMGVGLIICSHAVSEAWGVRNLAKYIERTFPDVPVHYIDVGCPYRLVSG